jgi:hypothetical protein
MILIFEIVTFYTSGKEIYFHINDLKSYLYISGAVFEEISPLCTLVLFPICCCRIPYFLGDEKRIIFLDNI